MPDAEIDNSLFERFMDILRIERRRPSIDALTELVTAYMTRIPFENISKLYYRKRFNLEKLPDMERYLAGVEKYNFGGTCFSNNYFLHLLLRHLGYDAMLCGADMNNPDCHLVNMATVEGREFLIDPGYGAPFVKPLPRDLSHDIEVKSGRDRYVLRPMDDRRYSRLDLYRDGELVHGYTAKPIPRTIDFFARSIEGSFGSTATFMNCLLVVRQFENRSVVIHNTTVIESEGEDYKTTRLEDRSELPETIDKYMGIPGKIVSDALSMLGELQSPWN